MHEHGPLVSIITPSFNQGAYIEQTILSVWKQDYARIEHIIVDGGSTDGTLDIIRRHEEACGLRWISEPDGGMYEAINKGLRMARGEILAYLNSDDRYFPWTVGTAVKELASHPEAGFVFGDMLNVDEETGINVLYLFPPFWLEHIRRSAFLGQPTVFWRRSVFEEQGGFDESLKFVADCDYWMRIGAHYPVRKIDEVLAIELNHPHAKRFAQEQELRQELEEVRSRYISLEGTRYRAGLLMDRVYNFSWRRRRLSRFLLAYLLRYRRSARSGLPWREFLTRGGKVRVFVGSALAAHLPFTKGRFDKRIVRKNLTF